VNLQPTDRLPASFTREEWHIIRAGLDQIEDLREICRHAIPGSLIQDHLKYHRDQLNSIRNIIDEILLMPGVSQPRRYDDI